MIVGFRFKKRVFILLFVICLIYVLEVCLDIVFFDFRKEIFKKMEDE